jgi:integrase
MKQGGRPRTGGLFQRKGQWYARFRKDVEGETVRVVRALGTDNKQVARAKLARLLKEELPVDQATRGETFEEAARRVADAQVAAGSKSWTENLSRLREHVFPELGSMPVETIKARHIADMLEGVRITDRRSGLDAMPAHATLKRLLANVSTVLDDLWRKEQLLENVAKRVRVPKTGHRVTERAVLTDFELARYLKWQHPDERAQVAVLERQTMSCIARLFGGVRSGDLHVMTWESLDAANGRFEWGYAPRSKTSNPQRLLIDEMLRPILRRWWKSKGEPRMGLVFPVLRDGRHSTADKQGEKHHVSHAEALRRDLRRAFGIDRFESVHVKRKNGRAMDAYQWVEVRQPTPREVELLFGTKNTLPVDFHSWRRAYCQALADAGVNAQLAKALAGHSTEAAHERYLRSSETARALPEQARPRIDLSKVKKIPVRSMGSRRSQSKAFLRGAVGDRTPDLRTASAALSQLSYSPEREPKDSQTQHGGEEIRHATQIRRDSLPAGRGRHSLGPTCQSGSGLCQIIDVRVVEGPAFARVGRRANLTPTWAKP